MTIRDAGSSAAGWLRAVAGLPERAARTGAGLLVAPLGAVRAPSPARVRECYRGQAARYDVATAAGRPYRHATVLRLRPRAGEVVLDVGCGTGLNFADIEQGIGVEGRLVGIDCSPEMLARARERSARCGWDNVTLIEASAEVAEAPLQADAALLCGTHDILRSPAALGNILRQLKPGGRIVAGGPKWAPLWWPGAPALNLYTWQLNRRYVTTFEGFDRPWSHLARVVPDLAVEEVFFGGGYIAAGRRPPRA
jgi:ubiquinone/menaquinone biosynthesis C-methylase UbiE